MTNRISLQEALSDPNVFLDVRSIPHAVTQYLGSGRASTRSTNKYDWAITIKGYGQKIEIISDYPFATRQEAVQSGKAVLGCLRAKFEPVIR